MGVNGPQNLKFELQKFPFLSVQGWCVPNFRSVAPKLWPVASGQTYIHTYISIGRTETEKTRAKPNYLARLGAGEYTVQVCKQYWLVNITGLYRLEVSKKVLVSPSAFQYHIIEFFDFFHSDLSFRHFSCSRSSFLKKKIVSRNLKKNILYQNIQLRELFRRSRFIQK